MDMFICMPSKAILRVMNITEVGLKPNISQTGRGHASKTWIPEFDSLTQGGSTSRTLHHGYNPQVAAPAPCRPTCAERPFVRLVKV